MQSVREIITYNYMLDFNSGIPRNTYIRETRRDNTMKNNLRSSCAPATRYSERRSTLIVACTAAVKLLELIESRARYRDNETRQLTAASLMDHRDHQDRRRTSETTHTLGRQVGVAVLAVAVIVVDDVDRFPVNTQGTFMTTLKEVLDRCTAMA